VGQVLLEMDEQVAAGPRPELLVERAIKAFDFSLGLRVIGTPMPGMNVEANEAGLEPGDPEWVLAARAEGVITEDVLGEATVGKGCPQDVPGGLHGAVQTDLESQQIARMVIDNGEREDTLALDLKGTFEIELPQVIGRGVLEALHGRLLVGRGVDTPVACEDCLNGLSAGHRDAALLEEGADLATTPAEAVTYFQDLCFQIGAGAPR